MHHLNRKELAREFGQRRYTSCSRCHNRRTVYFVDPQNPTCFDCSQNDRLTGALAAFVEAVETKWRKTTPAKEFIEPYLKALVVLGRVKR